MLVGDLGLTDDASAGEWIAQRLRGDFGAVTLQVPSGYEAYVRICHPAADHDEHSVTWPQVASATGRIAHALMQWHALVGSPDSLNFTGSLWPDAAPERGNLAPDVLKHVCAMFGAHTSDAAHCFFGLWTGWGWVHGGGIRFTLRSVEGSDSSTAEPPELIPPAFSVDELSRPLLELPSREYLLFSGPLSAATQIGDPTACWDLIRSHRTSCGLLTVHGSSPARSISTPRSSGAPAISSSPSSTTPASTRGLLDPTTHSPTTPTASI